MSIEIDDDGAGWGVRGNSKTGLGVVGIAQEATGVAGGSLVGDGIRAVSVNGRGLFALAGGDAIVGQGGKRGVVGISKDDVGVSGDSTSRNGIFGRTQAGGAAGVFGLNEAEDGGNGVTGLARGSGGTGVFGSAALRGVGVVGNGATGMVALGSSGHGLSAASDQQHGVTAQAKRKEFAAVRGEHLVDGTGVRGESVGGIGVEGISRFGVWGASDQGGGSHASGVVGVFGAEPPGGWEASTQRAAVCAISSDGVAPGVSAISSGFAPAIQGVCVDGAGAGVTGAGSFFGVIGSITTTKPSQLCAAVSGSAQYDSHVAVLGAATWSATGVKGTSENGLAVIGWCQGGGTGIYGFSPNFKNVNGQAWAGQFHGAVNVTGPVYKSGGGFLIDHPLDPGGMLLCHSFVESDERKNIYDGVVELDGDGAADVALPNWFEAANKDFRYQLTAIGRGAPDLHVEREIEAGSFRIAGGHKGQRICWQVTGCRADAWAAANPQAVEIDKPAADRTLFRHPELFGFGRNESLDRHQHQPHVSNRSDGPESVLQALKTGILRQ